MKEAFELHFFPLNDLRFLLHFFIGNTERIIHQYCSLPYFNHIMGSQTRRITCNDIGLFFLIPPHTINPQHGGLFPGQYKLNNPYIAVWFAAEREQRKKLRLQWKFQILWTCSVYWSHNTSVLRWHSPNESWTWIYVLPSLCSETTHGLGGLFCCSVIWSKTCWIFDVVFPATNFGLGLINITSQT